ncbi:MAG: permease [Nanoarchaeota archaeon]|nr:permease [Nanoarchaeota archaeon]
MTSEKSYAGWYFLAVCAAIYLIAFIIKPETGLPVIKLFSRIILNVLPVFILIFALLVAVDYLVKPVMLLKYFGKGSGLKAYLLSLLGGIISTGPIYMWYPLMNDLQKKGISNGFLATFLYGRAIKPALIPLMILYFGWIYTIVLSIVMAITAVLQGLLIGMIDRRWRL